MDDSTREHLSVERLLELGDFPIDDDAALLDRARSLIREGLVPRLWLLLLDGDGIMLPRLTQIDETPVTPEAEATAALHQLMGGIAEAGMSVAFVLERPGPPEPSPDDWAWHATIRRAGDGLGATLRGILLAHGGGVELLESSRPSGSGTA
ncbi:MAG: hypothetical protein ACQEWM_09260 [Actinomycetota bacterium]